MSESKIIGVRYPRARPQVTIDVNAQKVSEGVAYSFAQVFTLGASATVDLVLDLTPIAIGGQAVLLPFSFTATGGGPIYIDFYTGVTASLNGTLVEAYNRNFCCNNPTTVNMRIAPTVTDPGTQTPWRFQIPSNGVAAISEAPGITEQDVIIIAGNAKYMFRFINQDTTDISLGFQLTFYLGPNA